jgi:AcrR family transcriptional regulator
LDSLNGKSGVWRGTTAEERVLPRRRKLVQAGFEMLGEHGQAGTTVRGVCARANLNPRYFYESFDDLDALLRAVFDDIMAETTELTLAAIAAAPDTAEAKTRAALDACIRHITNDPRRIRIVLAEAADGVLGRQRAAIVDRTAEMMADQAATFFGIDRRDKLLISATLMITGGIGELLVAWSNGSTELTVDELIDHATLMTVGTSRAMGALAERRRAAG